MSTGSGLCAGSRRSSCKQASTAAGGSLPRTSDGKAASPSWILVYTSITVAPTKGGRPVSAWKIVAPIAHASAFRPLYGFPVSVSGAANAAVPAVEAMASSVPSKICATPKSLTLTQSDSPSPASSLRTAAAAVTVPRADPTSKSAGVRSCCDGPASRLPIPRWPKSLAADPATDPAVPLVAVLPPGRAKCDSDP